MFATIILANGNIVRDISNQLGHQPMPDPADFSETPSDPFEYPH